MNLEYNWQRVLSRLYYAKKYHKLYFSHKKDGKSVYFPTGYLPIWSFMRPGIGGSSGDRRLRELRGERGVPILKKKVKSKSYSIYKLGCECSEIDWNAVVNDPKWKYEPLVKCPECIEGIITFIDDDYVEEDNCFLCDGSEKISKKAFQEWLKKR